jgi:hypothetical protein
MTTITLGSLMKLARFVCEGIDGAADDLRGLLEDPEAYALVCETLSTSTAPRDAASFVAFLERRVKARRRDKRDVSRTEAYAIGRELGMRARPTLDGFELDTRTFDRLIAAGGYQEVVFVRGTNDVGCVRRTWLAAIMRELRTTTIERVSVDFGHGLSIVYRGRCSRGRLLLRLQGQSSGDSWVHVHLDDAAQARDFDMVSASRASA